MEDLYEIIGVPRDASQADIKKAYRKLAMQHHPDNNNGNSESETKFKKINAAYEVLSDPEKRSRYDQFGSAEGGQFGGFDGANLRDLFGDLFAQVFGGGMGFGGFGRPHDPNGQQQGTSLEMPVEVSLLEAAQGMTRSVEVSRYETCRTCGGNGAKPGTTPKICGACGGRGQVQTQQRTMFGSFVSVGPCGACGGKGKTIEEKCPECSGRGQTRAKHKLEVKIPAGVETGTRLRISGEGDAGTNGGPKGDLYIAIRVKTDQVFERQGGDIHRKFYVNYPQAVFGATLDVETLIDGVQKMNIPAGTTHGTMFKIKERGIPRLHGARGRGDLYVHIFVDIPKKLSDQEKEIIEKLAQEMKTPIGAPEEGLFDKFKKWIDS